MTITTLDRRRLLAGACGAALLLVSGGATEAARPFRIVAKTIGAVIKAVGKKVKLMISAAINVAGFVWNGTVGTFEVAIGQTKTFVKNIAGMQMRFTAKVTTIIVNIRGKVEGAFGTLTDEITFAL
jgi:hypothetical protein